ncbi:hypothetical protein SAMN05421769_4022 [Chryseobacterium scophthalmum]|uniref:Uncharacterized protein n=1 Tax=Chryseobacterium scophthalmum TaxID=59733 RepID=A0A1N6J391_9FLAO|nr:hypothetical protein SAMN05421769_4022 [Chryseobacterium scophthalmum]
MIKGYDKSLMKLENKVRLKSILLIILCSLNFKKDKKIFALKKITH